MVDKSFSFHKKTAFDFEKSKAKVLDVKKDALSRLRHLKLISEKCSLHDVEEFYKRTYNFIYHTIHESMKTSDPQPTIKPVAATSKQREDNELIVTTFEALLRFIPDVIKRKWQYHSIGNFIFRLLQTDVLSKTYNDGLKLFVMWYSILMDDAEGNVQGMFRKLLLSGSSSASTGHSADAVSVHDLFVFHLFLKHLVTQVGKIQWDSCIDSYNFVIRNLNVHYLGKIFPTFKTLDYFTLKHDEFNIDEDGTGQGLSNLQLLFVNWLVGIVKSDQRTQSIQRERFGILVEELFTDLNVDEGSSELSSSINNELVFPAIQIRSSSPGIRSPKIVNALESKRPLPPEPGNNQSDKYRFLFTVDERLMVQNALFSNKSNVNMVLEIFHQILRNSRSNCNIVKEVLQIYKQWLKGQHIPHFFEQSDSKATKNYNNTTIMKDPDPKDDFKIGKQKLIQIFICQSWSVLFRNWKKLCNCDRKSGVGKPLDEQVNLCHVGLNLYRYLIMDVPMDTNSWMCLLKRIIIICNNLVLPHSSEPTMLDDMNKKVIETLIVAFVRASLTCHLQKDIWEQMSCTMNSLVNAPMVVHHWTSIMVTLTKMLGFSLYKLDLFNDTSDAKNKRIRLKNVQTKKTQLLLELLDERIVTNPKVSVVDEDEKPSDQKQRNLRSSPLTTSLPLDSKTGRELFQHPSKCNNPDITTFLIPPLESPKEECPDDFLTSSDLGYDKIAPTSDQFPTVLRYIDFSANYEANKLRHSQSEIMKQSASSGSFETQQSNDLLVYNFQSGNSETNSISSEEAKNLDKSLNVSETKEMMVAREFFIDDKSVEMNLTELKECCMGQEFIKTVWMKMLGIFGNIGNSPNNNLHLLVVNSLKPIHDCILKIYTHPDFIDDNKFPVLILVPWLLQIIHTPDQPVKSKLNAFSLLYDYLVHVTLHPYYLSMFYFSIHVGLQSSIKEIPCAIVRQYSSKIMGLHHNSSIILLEDFLSVALRIINNQEFDRSQVPDKIEALKFLASCVSIPNHYPHFNVLDPKTPNIQLTSCDPTLLKGVIISGLLTPIRQNEKHSGVCCVSICGLGIHIYEELSCNPTNPLISHVVESLLSLFSFDTECQHNNTEKLVASQIFSMLRDHSTVLLQDCKNVLQDLLEHLVNYVDFSVKTLKFFKEIEVVRSLTMCILEWFLVLPVTFLLERIENISLLEYFFRVLTLANSTLNVESRKMDENTSKQDSFPPTVFFNFVFCHLINHFGRVTELKDVESSNIEPLQMMSFYGNRILEISYSHFPNKIDSKGLLPPSLSPYFKSLPYCDITTRNLAGKWQWFIQGIECNNYDGSSSDVEDINFNVEEASENNNKNLINTSISSNILLNEVKQEEEEEEDEDDDDVLIMALNLISDTSPECCPYSEYQPLAVPCPCLKLVHCQNPTIDALVKQDLDTNNFLNSFEKKFNPCKRCYELPEMTVCKPGTFMKIGQSFGFFQSKERQYIDFLKNDEKSLREIKHFDSQRCHETHKIAVFYVGPNQDHKTDILLNSKGSVMFEEFLSQLGAMVNLKNHKGFMGGLSQSGGSGAKAPYYSPSSLLQVMFHVSTLLTPCQPNVSDEEICITKMRHLGNDEVHIVWSENEKHYTTDVIPTSFGEATIVIYPLPNGLFKIQIIRKIMMGSFGPLFDGAIVGKLNLSSLVRTTAINGGRVIRERRKYYNNFYEERYSTLCKIVSTHMKQETYEDFVHSILVPGFNDSNPLPPQFEIGADHEMLSNAIKELESRTKSVYGTKKQKSEFVLPLRIRSEKRSKDTGHIK